MANWKFTKGIHDIGNGCYGYIQPDGTWGWSNAGLIESRGETLLVDTLMGLDITRAMLDEMHRKIPASRNIDMLVNTHSNPDHVLGNELVEGAEIIAAQATAEEMADLNLEELNQVMTEGWKNMGKTGEFLFEAMGSKFDFSGVTLALPTKTFEKELTLSVGDKTIHLRDFGPAHTRGDTVVHSLEDKVLYTGDLLFNESHPIIWSGPVANWIAACDFILDLDVETIVPGHGPITDKTAVKNFKHYLAYIRDEARARYDAGLQWEEAANEISLDEFRGWTDVERITTNVFALYREFGASLEPATEPLLFGAMARYKNRHGNH